MLHLGALSQRESVLDIDAEVANRALDLRMAEQDLHGTQVTCLLVDDGRLGSAERMGSVVFPAQSDPAHPFVNEPCILPRADMIGMIKPGSGRRSRRECLLDIRTKRVDCHGQARGARTEWGGRFSVELR
jgi:hypothetical protein